MTWSFAAVFVMAAVAMHYITRPPPDVEWDHVVPPTRFVRWFLVLLAAVPLPGVLFALALVVSPGLISPEQLNRTEAAIGVIIGLAALSIGLTLIRTTLLRIGPSGIYCLGYHPWSHVEVDNDKLVVQSRWVLAARRKYPLSFWQLHHDQRDMVKMKASLH